MYTQVGFEDSVQERVVKTVCPMCAMRCGIDVHMRGNTIVKVEPMREHVMHRLCLKSTAIPDYHNSRDRLLYPLKRVGGGWERVSWDDAFDFIIGKLNQIRETYGPEALALTFGHSLWNKEAIPLTKTFAKAYGTPNYFVCGNWNIYTSMISSRLTFGGLWLSPNVGKAKCVVDWATNSWNSMPPTRHILSTLRDRGGKYIVIDPRVTRTAKMADLHLRPRPGTDLALGLAFINLIISEGLYDKDFVREQTTGFDKLAEAVEKYTPKWAAVVTGVPVAQIEECARLYATTRPACMNVWCGLDHGSQAFQNDRAKDILIAITGNYGSEGGNKTTEVPPGFLTWPMQDPEYVLTKKTFTSERFPLWDLTKEANGLLFPEAVLSRKPYPIKGLICQAANPSRTLLNTKKVNKALSELDLLVVMDIFMSATAEQAHIVLPACSGLESRFITNYVAGHLPLILVSNTVSEPAGESWSDGKFWLELGRRMGFTDQFPWKDIDELIEEILLDAGKTSEDMERLPQGYFYGAREHYSVTDEGFDTPTGKIEIYSETLERMGYPPLPVPYNEPLQGPVRTPDLFREYPLVAISGIRHEEYEHSWGRNFPRLRARRPDPELEIHPNDAQKYGITEGEWAIVESPIGAIKMKAVLTEDMMEGCVAMPEGWGGEANVNLITDDELLDPITGAGLSKGFLCRVRKAE